MTQPRLVEQAIQAASGREGWSHHHVAYSYRIKNLDMNMGLHHPKR